MHQVCQLTHSEFSSRDDVLTTDWRINPVVVVWRRLIVTMIASRVRACERARRPELGCCPARGVTKCLTPLEKDHCSVVFSGVDRRSNRGSYTVSSGLSGHASGPWHLVAHYTASIPPVRFVSRRGVMGRVPFSGVAGRQRHAKPVVNRSSRLAPGCVAARRARRAFPQRFCCN